MASKFLILAIVVAAAQPTLAANSCSDKADTTNHVKNPGFELDDIGTDPFRKMQPKDWRGYGSTVVAKNGNSPWGSTTSDSGEFYAIIQKSFTALEQTITGLKANRHYTVSLKATNRRFYAGEMELFDVVVNNDIVLHHVHTQEGIYETFVGTFKTDDKGEAKLVIRNTSPVYVPSGRNLLDASVFIDDVNVQLQQDCGEGASCQADGSDYTCSCTDPGYEGENAKNEKAKCTKTVDQVKLLQKQVDDLKTSFAENLEQLQDALGEAENLIEEQDTKIQILNGTINDVNLRNGDNANDITGLKDRVTKTETDISTHTGRLDDVEDTANDANKAAKDNADMLQKLKDALKSISAKLADRVSSATGSYNPGITSQLQGHLDVDIINGAHLTVNNKKVLVEDEVRDLVSKAIEDTLQALGDI